MEKIARGYRLSTGRELRANEGLISIARDADGTFRIREGYDGVVSGATGDPDDDEDTWTADERRELADFMIAQWTAFKEST
jgi:hypothetical protein